jgi:peptide/nickel transport system permease protein
MKTLWRLFHKVFLLSKRMGRRGDHRIMKYVGKRFLQLIPVLLGITFLSFAMMRIAGSDAITEMYADKGAVAQEIIDAKRAELGLDRPFMEQYVRWLGGLLTGDMGVSYVSGRNVFDTFVSKLPATLLLTLLSVIATILISIPLGVVAAVHHDRVVDYIIRFFSFIGNSLPNFFVGLLLMQLLAIKLGLLPVISSGTGLESAIMPTLTLAIAMSSKYMRQVRATVLEELNKEYVIGAKARGIRNHILLWKSVMKASMLTIITLLALSIGSLLGGTAIIESIFMWDGVGKLAVDAITMRDYPMIQAYVVWMAMIYVLVNLVTDLLYHLLDPRIRLGVNENA